jgi:hypothetical protein
MLRRRYQHFNTALGPTPVQKLEIRGQAIPGSSLCAGRVWSPDRVGGQHGANPRAATRKDKARRPGKVGLNLSGGNVDTDVYAQLLSA